MLPNLTYERDAAPDLAEIMARAAHARWRRTAEDRWHLLSPQAREDFIDQQRAAIAAGRLAGARIEFP